MKSGNSVDDYFSIPAREQGLHQGNGSKNGKEQTDTGKAESTEPRGFPGLGVGVVAERDRKDEGEERVKDYCGWKNSDTKTPGNTRQNRNS